MKQNTQKQNPDENRLRGAFRYITVIIALGIVLLQNACIDTRAEEPEKEAIRFDAILDDMESDRSMLDLINTFRTGDDAHYKMPDGTEKHVSGLSEITYDYALEGLAVARAREIAVYFDHVRPTTGKTVTDEKEADGENIAFGTDLDTPEKAMELWKEENEDYSGQGHRRNMLAPGFKTFAVGHVSVGSVHYWVQLFKCQDTGSEWYEPAKSRLLDSFMYVLPEYLGKHEVIEPSEEIFIPTGESVTRPGDFTTILHNKAFEGEEGFDVSVPLYLYNSEYDQEIEDTTIAAFSTETYTIDGLAKGRTNMLVSYTLNGITATLKIPIFVCTSVTKITQSAVFIKPGESLQLMPTIEPENADREDLYFYVNGGTKTKSFGSENSDTGDLEFELTSDNGTATVTQDGLLMGVKNGWMVVTIKSSSNTDLQPVAVDVFVSDGTDAHFEAAIEKYKDIWNKIDHFFDDDYGTDDHSGQVSSGQEDKTDAASDKTVKESEQKTKYQTGQSGDTDDEDAANSGKKKNKLSKVKDFSARKRGKKSVLLAWKPVEGASGYEVLYATDKKFKNRGPVYMSTETGLRVRKLKKGKKYYFRVRAYRFADDGTIVYGGYSAKKSVKL